MTFKDYPINKEKDGADMRILVVEDDRLLNNTLCYNLIAVGYIVDSAMTKAAALEFSKKQSYELVVLDVILPDANGFVLLFFGAATFSFISILYLL